MKRTYRFLLFFWLMMASWVSAQTMEEAVARLNQGDYRQAVEQLLAIWQRDTTQVEPLRLAGYACKLWGKPLRAISFYRKVLQIQPQDYDATLALARLYTIITNYPVAERFYRKLLQQDSTDVEALWGLADLSLWQDRLAEAEQYARQAIHYLPAHPAGYFRLARILIARGKLNAARQAYWQINRIDSTYSEAWAGLGQIAEWQNQPYRALNHYLRALQLDPGNATYQQAVKRMQSAMDFHIQSRGGLVQETENRADYSNYRLLLSFRKRINDRLEIHLQNSKLFLQRTLQRTATITSLEYDVQTVRVIWHASSGQITGEAGYSFARQQPERLRLDGWWDVLPSLRWFAGGEYSFFYAWENLYALSVRTGLRWQRGRFRVSANLRLGRILDDPVYDEHWMIQRQDNNRVSTSLSVEWLLYRAYNLRLLMGYSFNDHQYLSPYHYTPQRLEAYSVGFNFYREWSPFYLYGEGMVGTNSDRVDQAVASLETGFLINQWVVGFSSAFFSNPYYQNWSGELILKVRL